MNTLLAFFQALKTIKEIFPFFKEEHPDVHRFIMTILALFLTWGGLNIIRERDIIRGLQIAFMDSAENTTNRAVSAHVADLQEEFKKLPASNLAVQRIMQANMEFTQAARIKLGIIHNGTYSVTGIGLMQANTTQAIAAPGRSTGELLQNEPLSHWDDFLETIEKGKCSFMFVDQMKKSIAAQARFIELGARAFIVCPVIDSRSQTLGALFVMWDKFDPVPTGAELAQHMEQTIRSATQIAGAMEMLR